MTHKDLINKKTTPLIIPSKNNINSWEDIDRISGGMITNLTYTVLFVNDQVYNWSLILHDTLSKSHLYRQKAKGICNQIKKITENYISTVGGANLTKINKTALAIITSSMEEDVEKHINVYKYTISNILLKKGIDGERNEIASVCSTLNMLSQMSVLTVKDFGLFTKERYNVSYNPLEKLSLSRVEKLSNELSNVITGNIYVNLNEYPQIVDAFKAITNNLLKAEVFNRAFDEAEKFIKDENKYSISMV